MDSVPLHVKWGKEIVKFDFVVAGGVRGLKTELEEKTGVPAERMKLMAKTKGLWKGVLKDDFDLKGVDFAKVLKGGKELNLLLMGSAAQLSGPKTKTVFLEDLPPEERAKVQEPSGLVNLGNTCYLNSVVQCLRAIPPLRNGLVSPQAPSTASANPAHQVLMSSLRDTYQHLDRTSEAVPPTGLVRATKLAFPQFAQLGAHGQPQQQDAEEFYSGLLTVASSCWKSELAKVFPSTLVSNNNNNNTINWIDAIFGMEMEETLTCDELQDPMQVDGGSTEETEERLTEPPVVTTDLHRKLVCNIQGGSDATHTTNVGHIYEGIALSLEGKIEKRSSVLGRDAIWTRTQRIARLPPILVVQFGRFYWKATPESADHAGVKCKVMKPVAFSGTLDLYDFCTDKVKKILKVHRDKAAQQEEDRINLKLKGDIATTTTELDQEEHTKMDTTEESKTKEGEGEGDDEEQAALKAALAMSLEEEQPPVGLGLPDEFKGIYELFAVVTHKGRDADGGHYMAWVKAEQNHETVKKIADTDEDNEDWFVFDDDEVSPCKTEDVLKLKGGGDWHMSYLNFYRAKK